MWEGDQAGRLDAGANYARVLATAQTESFVVDQYVRFEEGARLTVYHDQSAPEGEIYQGPVWQALADGRLYVTDGVGNGCIVCPREYTGFTWVPGQW